VNNVLLTVGAACLVLAAVGGGGTVLGVKLREVVQVWRLVLLGLLGCVFLLGAYLLRDQAPSPQAQPANPQATQPASPQGDSQQVRDYRAAVAVTCANMAPNMNLFMAAGNSDGTGTFDRGRLQTALSAEITASQATMDQLWRRPVPKELAEDYRVARGVSDHYLMDTREQIDAIRTELPKTMSLQELLDWANGFSIKLRGSEVEFQTEMSKLAGSPCTPPTAPTR
jgi:hypothetical protein